MTLLDKTVLITGASRGIGRHIALSCARQGAKVALLARSGYAPSHPSLEGSLKNVKYEIENRGYKHAPLLFPIDLSSCSRDDLSKVMITIRSHFKSLDAVVLNASVVSVNRTPSRKEYDLMMNVNTRSTYDLLSLSIPYLRHSKEGGSLLSISPPLRTLSDEWIQPHPVYTMSKYGMSMLTVGFSTQVSSCHTLWPKKLLRTAATRMLEQKTGVQGYSEGKSPERFAEAATLLLTKKGSCQYLDSDLWKERGEEDEDEEEGVDDIFL